MNWFKYKLPDNPEIFCGASLNLIYGLGKGFAVAPFKDPTNAILTIPCDFEPDDADLVAVESSLSDSTDKSEYLLEVQSFINILQGSKGKIVAARTLKINGRIDLASTFSNLCASYPEAFVFIFSTDSTGTWIGASPELLLSVDGNEISTMALAGTRPAALDSEWDIKNIEEQQLVTDFIISCLADFCSDVVCAPTFTKDAGNIQHICTPVSATVANDFSNVSSSNYNTLRNILGSLSPTPAVCGSDRALSNKMIGKFEGARRELYGGFCGPNDLYGSTAFFVNLRSAKCSQSAACVYAGAGITPLSDPDDEWKETDIKSMTIISKLICYEY